MTLFTWPCHRCGHLFDAEDIESYCDSCRANGPLPFEVSGS